MSITYTYKERTLKRHTLSEICHAALGVMKNKHNKDRICTDVLKGKNDDELFTTQEMSDLVQEVVDDTLYHEGMWM